MNKKFNKKGVSEMVAYVILISIALGLAVAVFAWFRIYTNDIKPPIDCKEGTSVFLESYECNEISGDISLFIKNNGLFNVEGVIVRVGDDPDNVPVIMLKPDYSGTGSSVGVPTSGHFSFMVLKPGESEIAKFTKIKDDNSFYTPQYIKVVQIQPFIKDKRKIACIGSITTEKIECKINS